MEDHLLRNARAGSERGGKPFRQKLGEGASVRNSVIMQRCTIGEGADLECVIMDMDVVVRPGAVLRGTMDHPLVFKRGEVV